MALYLKMASGKLTRHQAVCPWQKESRFCCKNLMGEILCWNAKSINRGTQGFQFFLGMSADGKTGYRYNIGMWSSNDRSELLNLKNGKERGVLAEYSGEAIKR